MTRRLTVLALGAGIWACHPPIRVLAPSHQLSCGATPPRERPRPVVGAFLGDSARDSAAMRKSIDRYMALTGTRPGVVKVYSALGSSLARGAPIAAALAAIRAAGSLPLLTLEPTWNRASGGRNLLRALARGDADSIVRQRAVELRDLLGRDSLILEFAPEMNGRFGAPWQPSGLGTNDDTLAPPEFIAAWVRVHSVFRDAGAAGVRWLWSPSAGNPYTHRASGSQHWDWMERYYPGDSVVNMVGLHAFNDAESQHAWVPFVELVDGDAADRALSTLATRHPAKPIVLGELASSEFPGSGMRGAKGAWVAAAFAAIEQCPPVSTVVWFDARKERDWRIDSSPETLRAFRAAVGAP